jgi:sugar phosphate isomerase/epimerase
MNNINRKNFLKLSLGAAGALSLNSTFASSLFDMDGKKLKTFGLQLYSIRDAMAADAKDTLKQLSTFGYKQVQSFVGSKGMFWGMTPQDFKSYISDLGMTIHSSHCLPDATWEKKCADAAAIGMSYLIYPWEGAGKTIEDYKKIAEELNQSGVIAKKHGIRVAFHNHDYTFKAQNGIFGQDTLMQNTDASLVDYEMDMYWVAAAGQNPIDWFKKYPNRFVSGHVKDRKIGAVGNDASCVLGTGSIDYKKILKVAKKSGMKYYNVEQEKWEEGTPIHCAQMNALYLKKLKF